MSQLSAGVFERPVESDGSEVPLTEPVLPAKRSQWLPLLFLPALVFLGLSHATGGIPFFTDGGMVLLAAGCGLAVLGELRNFSKRFGIGGLVLFGGTLVWYSHDYFSNWFMGPAEHLQGAAAIQPETVAKAAFMTGLFVMSAAVGLLLPWGRWLERVLTRVPEPANPGFHFVMVMVLCLIGISPYFIFVDEPFFVAIYKDITAMRSGGGAAWTVGRTGNLNYNWGGYVAHILQIGWLGGLLATAYALFVAGSALTKLICWGWYALWFLLVFGSGARGHVVALGLPVGFLLFIKYHNEAAQYFRRYSFRAYAYSALGFVLFLGVIQFQGVFRTSHVDEWNLSEVELFKNRGNHMFSEGLMAYQMVPDQVPHPGVTFRGASLVRPLPDVVIRFAIGWIPRAVWKGKPGFSEFGAMYNEMMSGGTAENTIGATIAISVAGGAYVNYGVIGVIQIGLLFGWLCALAERVFLRNNNRLIVILFGLGMATWMFRCFRDLTPHDLYPLLIAIAAYSMLVLLLRPFSGPAPASAEAA